MRRGKAFHAQFTAWDTAANAPKTGDAANIITFLSRDGAAGVLATNAATEVNNELGAASALYDVLITTAEADVNEMTVVPRSSTPGIQIERIYVTMDQFEGPYDVVVHLQDLGGVAITDATVRLLNVTQTVSVDEKITNTVGNAEFGLSAATYKVRIQKTGWSFTVPETMIVNADGTFIFIGTALSSAAAPAGTQKLKGYCILPSDAAATDCVISAYITKKNVLSDHNVLSKQSLTYTVTTTKYWELILVQGIEYAILGKTPEGVIFLTAKITVTTDAELWIDDYDVDEEE
jgi:hypothetical protein